MISSDRTKKHNTSNRKFQLFHPYEIAFCGYSDSGKTTLVTRLIERLSSTYSIGYVKHDIHKFEMDKEGKDTQIAWSKGASEVFISDKNHTAHIHKGTPEKPEMQKSLLNCDLVFLEGYKNSKVPKIIVFDEDLKILEKVEHHDVDHVIAFVGKPNSIDDLPANVPYFQRDDVEAIENFILSHIKSRVQSTPFYGLVLAGGRSTRMKQDKALLQYHGKTQLEVGYELLSKFCEKTFVSSRKDQWDLEEVNELPAIHDRLLDFGPMGGILSAQMEHPNATWLVVSCDLPFLDSKTIQELIEKRDPFKFATCYQSSHNEFPEPLCTIYEPKSHLRLLEWLGLGYQCPRKVLINSPIQILKQQRPRSLENINTIEEFKLAKQDLEQEAHL